MPSANFGQKQKSADSLAKSRGEDWGLPDAHDGAVPVTRPIVVECQANRLRVIGPDGKSIQKEIAMTSETGDSVDELVATVWDQMKGWGLAGRGLYWQPTLVMRVAPDAQQRYADLQGLLAHSGLELKQSSKPMATSRQPTAPRRK
jgi:hypothetical protein